MQDGKTVDVHNVHHEALKALIKAHILSSEGNTESNRCWLDTLAGITAPRNVPQDFQSLRSGILCKSPLKQVEKLRRGWVKELSEKLLKL